LPARISVVVEWAVRTGSVSPHSRLRLRVPMLMTSRRTETIGARVGLSREKAKCRRRRRGRARVARGLFEQLAEDGAVDRPDRAGAGERRAVGLFTPGPGKGSAYAALSDSYDDSGRRHPRQAAAGDGGRVHAVRRVRRSDHPAQRPADALLRLL